MTIPTEQIPFNGAPVIPEAGKIHQPVVLMLDTSESMGWNKGGSSLPIDELNAGVRAFLQSWSDHEIGKVVDIAVVEFDCNAKIVQGFQSAASINALPPFTAIGTTALGAALNLSLDLIEDYKGRLHASGTEYHRPWIVCITDGTPTDLNVVAGATQRLRAMESRRGVVGYCVGVEGFDAGKMAEIFEKENILVLKNYNFNALFEFLHNSIVEVSQPDGGTEVQVSLPDDVRPQFTVHR